MVGIVLDKGWGVLHRERMRKTREHREIVSAVPDDDDLIGSDAVLLAIFDKSDSLVDTFCRDLQGRIAHDDGEIVGEDLLGRADRYLYAAGLPFVRVPYHLEKRGAGEIVLNMMNQDGMKNGYDIKQLQAVQAVCQVPLIASGGAGSMEHFYQAFKEADVSGALAASVFHKNLINIGELKAYLKEKGVICRA